MVGVCDSDGVNDGSDEGATVIEGAGDTVGAVGSDETEGASDGIEDGLQEGLADASITLSTGPSVALNSRLRNSSPSTLVLSTVTSLRRTPVS